MLINIFKYEVKSWLKSPVFYLLLLFFLTIPLLMLLGTAGYFDGVENKSSTIALLNSPFEIYFYFKYFNKFLLFLLPVIVGTSLYKDYKTKVYHLLYSFPISKSTYVFGKFLGSILITILISLAIGAGFILAERILGVDDTTIGPLNLSSYLYIYLVFVLPNLITYGLLVFMVVASSRNIYAGFIIVLVLFLFQIIVGNAFTNSDLLKVLFEPLGENAVLYETRLWTDSDRNFTQLPLFGLILMNRLFWFGLMLFSFVLFYIKFDLQNDSPIKFTLPFGSKASNQRKLGRIESSLQRVSSVNYDFSFLGKLRSMFLLAKSDYLFMLKNWMFVLFAVFGILAINFALLKMINTGEFNLLPVTRLVLQLPLLFYSLMLMLFTFLFSGMLVHRAKQNNMSYLIDVTPVSNWSLFCSKLIALVGIQAILLLIMFICGIAIQAYNGYYNFDIQQYGFHLFFIKLPELFIWAILAICIHTFIPNLYLGLFVLLMAWLSIDGIQQIGWDHSLLQFNQAIDLSYTDLNGYGNGLKGHFLLRSYWFVFTTAIAAIAYLFWRRGVISSLKDRLLMAKERLNVPTLAIILLFVLSTLCLAFKVNHEERKKLSFEQSKSEMMDKYKSKFEKYAHESQPKISKMKLILDLFPEQRSFKARVDYQLFNPYSTPIEVLLIKTGFDEQTKMLLNRDHKVLDVDTLMQYSAYILSEPILPFDSLSISFEIANKDNHLLERNSSVIRNGTFLRHDILPRFGFLTDEHAPYPTDSLVSLSNFYYSDADLVTIESIITTSADQIAIGPGELINESKNGDRKTYHYKTNEAVKLNFSFHSGRFTSRTEVFKDYNIEVYHHKGHTENIDLMIDGLKTALDYNEQYFSNYPFKTIRIIEYPHTEESFSATLMANNIPTSEIQFIINSEAMKDKINLAFYVMAHELTHQWFGNEVMPAAAKGAKMLTESITEYISLKIYEQHLGKDAANRFLAGQHKRYLRGRKQGASNEEPLYLVKNEAQHIAYGKGAIAFNALAHYAGEAEVNRVLKSYLDLFRDSIAIYPTSLDLIQLLEEELAEKFDPIIDSYFKQVITYDNAIEAFEVVEIDDERQMVNLEFSIKKFVDEAILADDLNHESIEIGLYNDKEELVQLEKIKLLSKSNTLTVEVNEQISKVVLDPNYLLIDIDRSNN